MILLNWYKSDFTIFFFIFIRSLCCFGFLSRFETKFSYINIKYLMRKHMKHVTFPLHWKVVEKKCKKVHQDCSFLLLALAPFLSSELIKLFWSSFFPIFNFHEKFWSILSTNLKHYRMCVGSNRHVSRSPRLSVVQFGALPVLFKSNFTNIEQIIQIVCLMQAVFHGTVLSSIYSSRTNHWHSFIYEENFQWSKSICQGYTHI